MVYAAQMCIRDRYSVEEYRVMGYLAERLCGIYLTYLKRQKEIRFFELPKTLFHDTEPRENVLPVFENGVPIVLSANDKFSPYLDIMIRSIIENASLSRTYDTVSYTHLRDERYERDEKDFASTASRIFERTGLCLL